MLVVSKVANFSIDLPEASVAIQVSGTFGSRQEEAQRLGRILRPKADGRTARFYSVVARDTMDQDFARIGSGSWPSRGTPTGSWTPRTSCTRPTPPDLGAARGTPPCLPRRSQSDDDVAGPGEGQQSLV